MDVESIEPRGKAETRKTISPKGVITRLKEEKTLYQRHFLSLLWVRLKEEKSLPKGVITSAAIIYSSVCLKRTLKNIRAAILVCAKTDSLISMKAHKYYFDTKLATNNFISQLLQKSNPILLLTDQSLNES